MITVEEARSNTDAHWKEKLAPIIEAELARINQAITEASLEGKHCIAIKRPMLLEPELLLLAFPGFEFREFWNQRNGDMTFINWVRK